MKNKRKILGIFNDAAEVAAAAVSATIFVGTAMAAWELHQKGNSRAAIHVMGMGGAAAAWFADKCLTRRDANDRAHQSQDVSRPLTYSNLKDGLKQFVKDTIPGLGK